MTVKFRFFHYLLRKKYARTALYTRPPCFQVESTEEEIRNMTESQQFWARNKQSTSSWPKTLALSSSTEYQQHDRVPCHNIKIQSNEWVVSIEDVMGRLYGSAAPFFAGISDDEPYREQLRTDAVYERFVRPILRNMTELERLLVQVICFDKPDFIPPEKRPVQKQRISKIMPYPKHARLVDAGIDVSNCQYVPQIEPLDLTRLLADRESRYKLYLYFVSKLIHDPRLHVPYARLILDFACPGRASDGPWIICNGKARQDPTLANEKGEGDLAAFWWALHYRKHHIIINSVDHDLMLVAMLDVEAQFLATLLVQCQEGECVNVKLLVRLFEAAKRSIRGFVLGCILCGTDFVNKSHLTKFFGDELVVEVAMRFWTPDRSLHNSKDFERLVKSLYANATNSRCKYPSELMQQIGYQALVFNMHYWCTIDGTLTLPHIQFQPSRKRKHPASDHSSKTYDKADTDSSRDDQLVDRDDDAKPVVDKDDDNDDKAQVDPSNGETKTLESDQTAMDLASPLSISSPSSTSSHTKRQRTSPMEVDAIPDPVLVMPPDDTQEASPSVSTELLRRGTKRQRDSDSGRHQVKTKARSKRLRKRQDQDDA